MSGPSLPALRADRFFINGSWVEPSSDKSITVMDSTTGAPFLEFAEAGPADLDRAVGSARAAFDHGPWPRMSHAERAGYLRAIAQQWRARSADVEAVFPREVGALHTTAKQMVEKAAAEYEIYAGLLDRFEFEERMTPTAGGAFGLLSHEPVGVVGAIVPWNAPISSIAHKLGPALLAGCTVVLKVSPEAPAEGYIAAEIAAAVGLPAGVLNVVLADREVSELLVADPRVDKIAFTGSTATGRRIASICGDRIARCSLELGGKSAALVLDDADVERAAATLAAAECRLSGQVCASLTRIVVDRSVYSQFTEAIREAFGRIRVGDPYDPDAQLGPLSTERHRERVEGYIRRGIEEGATLLSGGGRPRHLERGYYVEPTLFAAPDNSLAIAQEEIFGPVLTMIEARDEAHAVEIANDTIYGLNASVFTRDSDRALAVARRIRSGTVGHNAPRSDFGIAFGGFKQSGLGREGGVEGLRAYLEPKTMIFDAVPGGFAEAGERA